MAHVHGGLGPSDSQKSFWVWSPSLEFGAIGLFPGDLWLPCRINSFQDILWCGRILCIHGRGIFPAGGLQLDCALHEFTGLTPAQRLRRRLLESNQVTCTERNKLPPLTFQRMKFHARHPNRLVDEHEAEVGRHLDPIVPGLQPPSRKK